MKRKRAMAFNEQGGTVAWIGATAQNMIQNGGYMPAATCYNGADVYGGTDYSYRNWKGTAAKSFRKKFDLIEYALIDANDMWDDIFLLGHLEEKGAIPRLVFYFLGWRIVVEFFDENAIIDFTSRVDEGADLERAKRRFVDVYSQRWNVQILNDHLINVQSM